MFYDWIICSPFTTEASSPVSPTAPSTPTDNNNLCNVDVHAEQMKLVASMQNSRESAAQNDFLGLYAFSSPSKQPLSSGPGPSGLTATNSTTGPRHAFSRAHESPTMGLSMNAEVGMRSETTNGVHQPQGFGRDGPLIANPMAASSLSSSVTASISTPSPMAVMHSSNFFSEGSAGYTPHVRDAPVRTLQNIAAGTPPSMHITGATTTVDTDSSLLLPFSHMLSAGHPTPPTSSMVSATSLTLTPGFGVSPIDRRGSQQQSELKSGFQFTPLAHSQTADAEKEMHTTVETPSSSPFSVASNTQSPSPFPLLSPQPLLNPHSSVNIHPMYDALTMPSPDNSAKNNAFVPLAHPRPQLPLPSAHVDPQLYPRVFGPVTGLQSASCSPASTARSTPALSPTRPHSSVSNVNMKTTRSNHVYGREGPRDRKLSPPPRRFFPFGPPLLVAHTYLTPIASANGTLNLTPLNFFRSSSRTHSPAPTLSRQRSRTESPAPSGASTPISALTKDLPRGPLDDPFPAASEDNKENHSSSNGRNNGIVDSGGPHPYRTRSKQKGASLRFAALVKERDDDLAIIRKGFKAARGVLDECTVVAEESETGNKTQADVDEDIDADAETDPDVETSSRLPVLSVTRNGRHTKSLKGVTNAPDNVRSESRRLAQPPVTSSRSTIKRSREVFEEHGVERREQSSGGREGPSKRTRLSVKSANSDSPSGSTRLRSSPVKATVTTVSPVATRRSARNAIKGIQIKEEEIKQPASTDDDMDSDLSSLPPSSPPPIVGIEKRKAARAMLSNPRSKRARISKSKTFPKDESDSDNLLSSLSELEDDASDLDGEYLSADESKSLLLNKKLRSKPKPKRKVNTRAVESEGVVATYIDAGNVDLESLRVENLITPAESTQKHALFPSGVRSFDGEDGRGVGALHADFPLLYRRFPVISFFQPGDARFPAASSEPPSISGSVFNPPRSALDLYTPRFVKGIGREKCGLCPICYEPKERGGEGRSEWLSMKFSAFNYHMQYVHGISPSSALPFSPPTAFRRSKRKVNHKNEKDSLLEGHCHRCGEWAPMEGVKCVEAKLKEIYWWKHAAQCHKGSSIPGESAAHLDDELGHEILRAYATVQRDSNPKEASGSRSTLNLSSRICETSMAKTDDASQVA